MSIDEGDAMCSKLVRKLTHYLSEHPQPDTSHLAVSNEKAPISAINPVILAKVSRYSSCGTEGGGLMQRSPSPIDAEQPRVAQPVPIYRISANEYELRCGVCGKIAYADQETASRVKEALGAGLENPFLCEICEVYDDLSYDR